MKGYALLDSGYGRKLERFETIVLDRPCSQAIWKPTCDTQYWKNAHARFERISEKEGHWKVLKKLPESWELHIGENKIKLSTTPFGHLGIFPEQHAQWEWLSECVQKNKKENMKVLNLFAYSGGSTLACAKQGAKVVHLDASRPMVAWAKENAKLSSLKSDAVVWVLEDVTKFLKRELRRENKYDGIILDPPSFGRGPKKELFKIEQDFQELIELCVSLLSEDASFMLLSCHTPGITACVLENVMRTVLPPKKGTIESGEMLLEGEANVLPLPSGCYARWLNLD